MKQDSYQPVDDVLQRVLQKHKTSMKNRYENLFEGIKTPENKTLLNRIYTQLYIIEGESEGVNEEHEILQMEKKSSRYLQDTPINCSDIFKPVENPEGETEDQNIRAVGVSGLRRIKSKEDEGPKKIRTVLTKGIAGIGKTVSVQKFILDWAEGKANQDVDFMFVLPFRELNLIKDDQYSLQTLLCAFHPDLKDLDPKIYDNCGVVFIFDGLDESKPVLNFEECEKVSDITMISSIDVLIKNLFEGELLPSAHIWITSRPAAANQIPPQFISRVTEIQGFNEPQKEEYFRKKISDQVQAQKIISHIKTARSLHIMCHIPVFCWISATVLQRILRQSDTEIPKTLTEMYCHFLIIQTSIKDEKYEENVQRNPEKLLESNRTVLLKLAELAFNQLMKGNVMFYEEDLRESGIDLKEASVYSGICTEIFREQCVLYQKKVYSFVHLSFQEFLAALYVFHCYLNKNMEVLEYFKPWYSRWTEKDPLYDLLRGAVDKALKTQNGHLDLFLRFLLGISLESRQKILQGLLIHTVNSSESINKTVQHIKENMEDEELPNERCINLFLCLTEVKDQHLSKKIQEFLKLEKHSEYKLSAVECSTLCCMLQISEEVLDELDLKKYCISRRAYMKLFPAVNNCRKIINVKLISIALPEVYLFFVYRLADCKLAEEHCEILGSALKSKNSSLIELDLSNNEMQDSGVELLSAGLKSSHLCIILYTIMLSCLKQWKNPHHDNSGVLLEGTLFCICFHKYFLFLCRLSGCMVTEEGCVSLAAALTSNHSHLKDLDLTYNHPKEAGVKLLSDRLLDSHCLITATSVLNQCTHLNSVNILLYLFIGQLTIEVKHEYVSNLEYMWKSSSPVLAVSCCPRP
uniref:NACHT domain-containing protein n=1 Tax=Astyanax mexicanus TaxID=7994 RepID=A0A3B1KCF6_ASTMX